jgi:hypothetical protein
VYGGTTAIPPIDKLVLGPVLTQRYAPSMLPSEAKRAA